MLLVLMVLLLIQALAKAALHPGSDFIISVDGVPRTLQEAIDGGYFRSTHVYAASPYPNPGHGADRIWVSTNGNERTMLNALSVPYGLCGTIQTTSYSGAMPNPGHPATDIRVTVGGVTMSLQQAIDTSKFCECALGETRTKDCDYLDTSCRNYNDVTQTCTNSGTWVNTPCNSYVDATRTKDCDYLDTICRNYNDVTETCDSSGNWANPPCNSYTNAAKGTNCGRICPRCIGCACIITDSESCDGAGQCLAWTGTGCSNCPFGTTSEGTPEGFGGQIIRCKLTDSSGTRYQGIVTGKMSSFSYGGSNGKGELQCQWNYCCAWQLICITARCSDTYSWIIKP
jgi:phage tail protein X